MLNSKQKPVCNWLSIAEFISKAKTFICNLKFIIYFIVCRIIMLAIYEERIFLDHLFDWVLDVKIGFAGWRIKQNNLMTEFYWGSVCFILVFYPRKARKVLELLKVKAMAFWFLVGGRFFNRPITAASLTVCFRDLYARRPKARGS